MTYRIIYQSRLFIALAMVVAVLMSFEWSKVLEKKVQLTVAHTYEIEDFKITRAFDEEISNKMRDCLWAIRTDDQLEGYIYVGEAPSMKNVFDFIIMFSPSFEIINTKILIYREKHGRQIGAKRWLDQFTGLKPGDHSILGDNIDGISGATISVKSMTQKVDEVLSDLPAQITQLK